jgi:F-type H+-transporting ATPase subunit b
MKSRLRVLALSLSVSLGGGSGLALAQQPQPAQPMRPFPGHPPAPGMGAPPGGRGQGVFRPDGRFQGGPPGTRPGRPGAPPGAAPGVKPPAHALQHEDDDHGGADHECPGHGPDDAPPLVNLWHGILMVNNERASQPGFFNHLLFRYQNAADPCDPRNEPPPYLAALFNFGVLAFVAYRFGRKPLADALERRKQAIMAEIETATQLKAKAEARLEGYEEELENIEAKLAAARAEYAAQAETEQKHILSEAEERRVRMRRDAEFRIEQERKTVREELLREAMIAATAGAEDLIRKKIASADQDRMASDFLAAVVPAMMGGDPPSPPARPALSSGGRS